MLTFFSGFNNDTPLLLIRSNPKKLVLNHLQCFVQLEFEVLRCPPLMQI